MCISTCTGWRRLIGSPKLQIIFNKRAIKYRSLLQKMTFKDKGSYESSPPCKTHLQMCLSCVYSFADVDPLCVYVCIFWLILAGLLTTAHQLSEIAVLMHTMSLLMSLLISVGLFWHICRDSATFTGLLKTAHRFLESAVLIHMCGMGWLRLVGSLKL